MKPQHFELNVIKQRLKALFLQVQNCMLLFVLQVTHPKQTNKQKVSE